MSLYPGQKNSNKERYGKSSRTVVDRFNGQLKRFSFLAGGLFLTTVLAMSSQAADAKAVEQRHARMTDKATKTLLLDVTRTATGQRLVTVGDRGHILYSDDSGLSWVQAKVPTIQMLTAVTFPSKNTGFAVGHDTLILKTEDGGESWTKVYDDPDLQSPLLDVWFENDRHGIAVGAYGAILTTSDGGKSWEEIRDSIDNEEEFHYNAIGSDSNGTVYIVGEAGMLFRSKDQGRSWDRLESPYMGSWFGVTASDDEVLIHGLRGTVYRTQDQGDSWQSLKSGTRQTLFGSIHLGNGKTILVGNSGSFLSGSSGRWNSVNRTDRMSLNALTAGADGSIVVVGQGGIHRMSAQGEELRAVGKTK